MEVERTFKVVASNLGFTQIKDEQLNVVRSMNNTFSGFIDTKAFNTFLAQPI